MFRKHSRTRLKTVTCLSATVIHFQSNYLKFAICLQMSCQVIRQNYSFRINLFLSDWREFLTNNTSAFELQLHSSTWSYSSLNLLRNSVSTDHSQSQVSFLFWRITLVAFLESYPFQPKLLTQSYCKVLRAKMKRSMLSRCLVIQSKYDHHEMMKGRYFIHASVVTIRRLFSSHDMFWSRWYLFIGLFISRFFCSFTCTM